jgi:PTH1 family peptidyl-tRNA hydrolase
LPVGHLRIRKKGSAGGHNGLASILQELGTNSVPRLRIGIGTPDIPAESYVLARFAPEQLPAMRAARERAMDAIFDIRDKGLETAMNFYNSQIF